MLNFLPQVQTETRISVLILRWRENPTISCKVLEHHLLSLNGTQLLLNKITKPFHAAMVSMDPMVPIVKIVNAMEPMVFWMDQLVVLVKEINPHQFLTTTETLKLDVLMKLLVIWQEILSLKQIKRNLNKLFLNLKTTRLRKYQYFKHQLLLATPLSIEILTDQIKLILT